MPKSTAKAAAINRNTAPVIRASEPFIGASSVLQTGSMRAQ